MFYVYFLRLEEAGGKKYYIGYSSDLKNRIKQHKSGEVKSTKNRNPELIYYEAFNDKYLALQRENGLKNNGSVYNALLRRLRLK